MRSLSAVFATAILMTATGVGAARAADPAEGYYEERDVYPPARIERRVERRVYVEEPLVEERVVVRRRVVEEAPARWRRVHIVEDRRWEGPRYGPRAHIVGEDAGW